MGRLRVVGFVLAVLVIAACGGDSGKVDVAVIGKGAAATIASRSFRFELTTGISEDQTVLSGAADLSRPVVWMGEGNDDVEPEFIIVGDRYYQASFRLPRSAGATTPWVLHDPVAEQARLQGETQATTCNVGDATLTLESGGTVAAQPLTTPGPPAGVVPDPSRLLADLKAAATSVDSAGSGTVRGVRTQIYDVALRPNPQLTDRTVPADADLPAEMRETQRKLLDAMRRPPKTRVWIDDADLVRRLEQRQEMGEDFGTSVIRFEFFDFGTSVSVTEPAPADVTPFLSLPRPFGDLGCTDDNEQLRSVKWVVTKEGEQAGRRWFLETGTSSAGAACVRLRTDPPFDDFAGEPGVPDYEEGTCSSDFTSAGSRWEGDFNSIYGVSPPGTDSARAKYKGGRTGDVVTVGDFWLVVWEEPPVLQSVEFLRKGRVLEVCEDIDNDDGPSC